MGPSKLLATLLLCTSSLMAHFPIEVGGQVLYFIHHGDTASALTRYLEYAHKVGEHDYELLQQVGITLLERGTSSGEQETQLMCLLGAGVSLCPPLLPILERGVQGEDVKAQLVALNFLSRLDDDEADRIFLDALSSPFLLTRLEACFQLSRKNHPAVLEHLQSLIIKVPEQIRPLFAQIVINLDSNSANQMMRQLLADRDLVTRCEAILAVARERRDDFLPQIRTLASQTQIIQQESAAIALGRLKDMSSLPLLHQMSQSKQTTVQLAACYALYQLGEKRGVETILEEAITGNLYAVALLGQIPTEESLNQLAHFLTHPSKDMRLNATLALLQQRDVRCLPHLGELLTSEKKDIGYIRSQSPGGGMKIWKTVVSASHKAKNYPGVMQESVGLREQILTLCVELPEEHFVKLARLVFEEELQHLVPITLELLSNHRSEETIALLKKQLNETTSPFVKNYCNLVLFRMGEEGPYQDYLIAWARERQNTLMIRFREDTAVDRQTSHSLTPEEESRLLIETFEALASAQNQAGIEALINAIAYGHEKNRYALAGLLIRTTE